MGPPGAATHGDEVRAASCRRASYQVRKKQAMDAIPVPPSPSRRTFSILGALLGGCLLWAYWPVLTAMVSRWASDPQYSHGFLVPVMATAILYRRRGRLARAAALPNRWGILLTLAGVEMYLAGAYVYFEWLEAVSLIPLAAGLLVLLGGWPALRWAWPAVLFLLFMVPLPYQIQTSLAEPLRRLATTASTYALQTIGLPALAEGNVIRLNEVRIGVVEACSGLSMLMVFFSLSTALALLIARPLWIKGILVISAVPIALLANITRITVTGLLHEWVGSRLADAFFHDVAGWLMMPLALGFLWVLLGVLDRLFIDVTVAEPVPIFFADKPVDQPCSAKPALETAAP
jgi:exosortase